MAIAKKITTAALTAILCSTLSVAWAQETGTNADVIGTWQRVNSETRAIFSGNGHGSVVGSTFIQGDATDEVLHVFSENAGAFAAERCNVQRCEQFVGILKGSEFYAVDQDSYYLGEVNGAQMELCMLKAGDGKFAGCMVYQKTASDPLLDAISGRTLVNSERTVTLNADGTLTGTDLNGTWYVEGGQFCRTLETGPDTFGPSECQHVIADGNAITFYSPTGRTASYFMN